ncbi:flavin-binding monooxygenase [Metarhizium robertsii]|uniref:Cyclin-like protein n=2 Tax=Metarhizium robertsii TaxID=568076 RepID=E9EK86_METRA|nr:Cyclin-like protein [Metarhizium robertsii ARSEF 23]XP_011411183.1 Cyclin-like protein [Metarhizium robertsii ARSEF 23]EFZ03426.1 Cyclin-like protein [Metarhizium robertsii ARSEF 23]EXU97631.1 flavin-binding monooxygenase [Metarhizium robertsii]KHO11420.1 Cyclin-like protein [Metarhizium robertsii ARSEF 23]
METKGKNNCKQTDSVTRNNHIAKMTTDDKPSVPRPTSGHGFAHQQVRRGVSKTVSIRRKRPIHGACRSAVPCARRPRQRPLQRTNAQPPRRRQRQSPVLILGCGFSRLLHAVHQVEAGTDPDNIRLVDTAGVFGGTWYWNRYPGPMVDVEASIYMPLLEETGHMPGHRFPHGPEIRRYIIHIAEK